MQRVNDKVEKYAMKLRQYSLRDVTTGSLFENKKNITKQQLKQLIKEELSVLAEDDEDSVMSVQDMHDGLASSAPEGFTKKQLEQIIKEEFQLTIEGTRPVAGTDFITGTPSGTPASEVGHSPSMFDVTARAEKKTAEVLEAVGELLDLQYGENQYDLAAKLEYLAKQAAIGTKKPETAETDVEAFNMPKAAPVGSSKERQLRHYGNRE